MHARCIAWFAELHASERDAPPTDVLSFAAYLPSLIERAIDRNAMRRIDATRF